MRPFCAGIACLSNAEGLLTFPLRHAGNAVYVAITTDIEPIIVKGNTVSHFLFKDKNKVKRYLFEKKVDEKEQAKSLKFMW